MNFATLLVGLIVLGLVSAVCVKLYRDKKAGRYSCGGNCGSCGCCNHCKPK